ncbi:MAG: hypothetical protein AB4372_34165 [Xenococcus sp. (in: cyanobacteria)]
MIIKPSNFLVTLWLILTFFFTGSVTLGQAATRIKFPQGSYCGSYSGNFSGGREFVLNLGRGQTFTSQNTGGGTQYDVFVTGPTGRIRGQQVSDNQIDYYIPVTGDYYIYVESTIQYNSIQFCAY